MDTRSLDYSSYRDYVGDILLGIMEKKMETTLTGYIRLWGVGSLLA